MAIGDDFSVAANGDIRHTANTNRYTVLELHRWLQDLADDQEATGNDLIDITQYTPSERSTDQIITLLDHSGLGGPTFNIDDTAAEYFYGGSIGQKGGDELYSGLRVLGAVNNVNTQLMVIQNHEFYQYTTTPSAPFWGDQSGGGFNGNAAGGVLMRCLIKSREFGADLDQKQIRVQARHWGDSYDFFNVTLGLAESVAAIGTTPDAQNTTLQATVTAYTDVLNSGGTANAPTGGYQLIDLNDGSGNQPYYSQWTFGTQTDGLKALWEYGKDLTGNGTAKSVDGIGGELFLGITHEVDWDAGAAFTERETVVWGTTINYDTLTGGTFTTGDYVTIGTNSGQVMYDDGVSQMIVALDTVGTDSVADNDVITEADGVGAVTAAIAGGTGVGFLDEDLQGGEGVILAATGTTTGTMWIQKTKGFAPSDNIPLYGLTSTTSATTNLAPTARTVPKIYLGSYTGTIIGAFGIGIDPNDLTSSDSVTDLDGDTNTPPNNQSFTVFGLVSGEDRVAVYPRTGAVIDYQQMTLNTTLSTTTETVAVMTAAIPVDTPQDTIIRIELDSGINKYVEVESWTGSTFTFDTTTYPTGVDFSGDNATSTNTPGVFIGYIDKVAAATSEAVTMVYNADRNLYVRVRDGGATPIKTYESDNAIFTSTGGSASASRITDA